MIYLFLVSFSLMNETSETGEKEQTLSGECGDIVAINGNGANER
jgi:hypothetical protein